MNLNLSKKEIEDICEAINDSIYAKYIEEALITDKDIVRIDDIKNNISSFISRSKNILSKLNKIKGD